MTIWTKRSPSTKLPEARPSWTRPAGRGPSRRRAASARGCAGRRSATPSSLTVVLPTLVAAAYLVLVATPQFDSEARFLIRGRSQAPPSGISEMMAGAGFRALA